MVPTDNDLLPSYDLFLPIWLPHNFIVIIVGYFCLLVYGGKWQEKVKITYLQKRDKEVDGTKNVSIDNKINESKKKKKKRRIFKVTNLIKG